MIVVDKEFESLIPPLTDEEFHQLEENILRDGIRDPICLWKDGSGQDILVDGHNRFKISAQHGGIPFQTKYILCSDREVVKQWIIRNQFGRRNLNAMQRSELALKLKPVIAQQAKERQGTRTDILENSPKSSPINTSEEIAKVAQVSDNTIRKVEHVLNKGSEETKEAARSGKISINEAYKRTVKENEPPKPDIQSVKEEHEAFKVAPVVSMDDIEIDKNNKRTIAIDLHQAILKTADSFEKLFMNDRPAELAEDAEGLTKEERAFLTARMYSIRNCVDSIIKILKGEMNGKR